MKHVLYTTLLVALMLNLIQHPASAQTPMDTCIVYGYLYNYDLSPAAGDSITVNRIVKDGITFITRQATFYSDSTGYIEIPLPQGCTAYLYGAVPGLNQYIGQGTPLAIPDTASALLATLTPLQSVPAAYIVAAERLVIKSNNAVLAGKIRYLDFASVFSATQSPTGEVNVTIDTLGTHEADRVSRIETQLLNLVVQDTVTILANDSVRVSVANATEKNVSLTYVSAKVSIAAEQTALSYKVYAAGTVTIFGVTGRRVHYIRIKES